MISVLIPSFNHANYLRQCLDSVLAQTIDAWEVVLVDDGSTDNSVEVAKTYNDPRIKVLENATNLGTYGTLQRALEESSGEYIAILNSDDVWAPTKLEQQLNAIGDLEFCFTFGNAIDGTGATIEEDIHADWPSASPCDLLPFLVEENRILASSVLFRRERLKFHTECRYSGDWVALLEFASRGLAACVPEKLVGWRIHPENAHRRSEGQAAEEIAVRLAIMERFGKVDRARISKSLMHLAALRVLRGEMGSARLAAVRALAIRPSAATLKRAAATALPSKAARLRLWRDASELAGGSLPVIRFD